MGVKAPRASSVASSHIPALDGVRAFAVLAVIAFHSLGSLPGGYFGVDVFFALSGFLITSLLVAEWSGHGTVSLRGFWARRARRLLPALFLMLTAVGVVAAVWPRVLGNPQLLGDALATVFYSANWHLIAQHANYFSATSTTQSALLPTWSLAIEEQFYLLWPVVVLAVLGGGIRPRRARVTPDELPERTRRRRLGVLLAVAGGGALASAAWMAVITPLVVHSANDLNRSYYGSDTRAQALLVGAALAIACVLWQPARSTWARFVLPWVGLAGVATLAALWAHVPETSALAFHGGFLIAALGTAAVIACVTQLPTSAVGSLLSLRPLRYLGRISYGMYLWYWPITLIVSGSRTGLQGYPLFALRLALVVAVASVSAYAVELPIRRGALPSWRAVVAMPAAAGVAILTVFVAGVVPTVAAAADTAPVTAPVAGPATASAAGHAVAAAGSSTLLDRHDASPVKVLVVGDSVAGTLGVGLSSVAADYDAVVLNEGSPGCSVSMDQSFQALWSTVPPGKPCRDGDPSALLDQWQAWVDEWNPDVVVYVARGETFDQEVGGQWEHLGEPAFDAYVAARFRAAVRVLGSRGAHVVLLTSPYYDSGTQVSGAPWPEDDPQRVNVDNGIIESVAAGTAPRSAPGVPAGDGAATASTGDGASGPVSVLALGNWISPGGQFSTDVGGVPVRCGDGVHFTVAGGQWVAARLFPRIVPLGRAHQSASPGGSWPTPLPQAPPAWYAPLPCATA
jgi:peptidoglycan/LPS O-acetylase OafA/YrhL